MTNDEIMLLVAQVMTSGIRQEGAKFTLPESMIIELVQRAQKAEREACALICEEVANKHARVHYPDLESVADECAGAIRSRGEK